MSDASNFEGVVSVKTGARTRPHSTIGRAVTIVGILLKEPLEKSALGMDELQKAYGGDIEFVGKGERVRLIYKAKSPTIGTARRLGEKFARDIQKHLGVKMTVCMQR